MKDSLRLQRTRVIVSAAVLILIPLLATAGDRQELDATDRWKGKTRSQVERELGQAKTIKHGKAGRVLVYELLLGLADTWIVLSRPPHEFDSLQPRFSQPPAPVTMPDVEVIYLPTEAELSPKHVDPYKWVHASSRRSDEVPYLTTQCKFYLNEEDEVERVVVKYPKRKVTKRRTDSKRNTSWATGYP